MSRAGIGWDSHRLEEGRRLVLGGVEIAGADRGLAGFSDADVLTHALIDALLGAAGLDDIGTHFPDTDERWRDADSIELLGAALGLIGEAGFAPSNVDLTVACETPRLAPYREDMRSRLAEALGLDLGAVNVKF
ncbi:MAG: 2-C-methyl-D-erythritol 2,4-cyclodiphosphate synthase, partial [Thermoleophilaceae bacterium]